MGLALIIYVFELRVEGNFNHIIIFLHRGVITNKADAIEFCPDADCGYSFVHRTEPRDNVAKSLINHKSAFEFVLIDMTAII